MYALYSAILRLALVFYLPIRAFRRRGQGREGAWRERRGRFEPGLPSEPRCWIHAVSVGEATAAAPLVEAIAHRWPELSIVMTTVTATGARIVRERVGGLVTHRYFPFDLPGSVGRALDAVRPRFFIGLETELWPNFLRALASRGIPAMIANGRISDRSFRRYLLLRRSVARMLSRIAVFAMQSEEDARRIIALGAPPERVLVTGNLKADLPAERTIRDPIWHAVLGNERGHPLWIAGSTHAGEEATILDAHQRLRSRFPQLRLLLAPRHPERATEVEALVRGRGFPAVRRTTMTGHPGDQAVIILDTVGELADLYGFADVVFIGGSLVPAGGHNMLEPAMRRKPVLFGPHTSNFRETADLLCAAGAAIVVKDALDLAREAERLLEDPELRRTMGEAGWSAVATRQGALSATLALVARHLMMER
ncbi:MAG TPA: 3-deoxy-D-manno-octulosonic acid transferase [Candidatus Methylomirabilis sp.]|nr:3-deoxy-D-manno-octulosonic acid transferase [Candidatus Methylomirabilis sp.]